MLPALQSLPGWLIASTLQGSLAILLVWLIMPLIRRSLGAQAAYILWGLVLLRLLVPWQPPSPFEWGAPTFTLPEAPAEATSGLKVSVTTEAAVAEPMAEDARPAQTMHAFRPPVALLIWLGGWLLILGFSAARSLRASRLASRARDISHEPHLLEILGDLPISGVRIRETGELRSPALTGLFRPVILLPLDWRERLSEEQLRCVLAHEVGHHLRRDLAWRWAFLLARALHWFNPLVWFAEHAARTDQEMACDEWVLRHDRTASPALYGEALLVSARKLGATRLGFSVQADMAESRVGLKRRIIHLTRIRPRGWMALTAGLMLTGLLLVITGPARSDAAADTARPPAESPKAPKPAPAELAKEEKPAVAVAPTARGSNVLIEIKVLEIPPALVSPRLGADKGPDGTIEVRTIYNNEEFQQFLRGLDKKEGVDLVSAPAVTTRSGLRATIQIVREFRYPSDFAQANGESLKAGLKIPLTPTAFETKPIGLTIECLPIARKDGTIDLAMSPRLVEFEGFVDFAGSREAKAALKEDALGDSYQPATEGGTIKQPIFAVREVDNKIIVRSGETVVLGGITSDFRKVLDTLAAGDSKDPPVKRALFIFVTATALRADGQKALSFGPAPAPVISRDGERFYAVPVPGKPGYVTSPFASEAGYVDVRGHKVGEEVKDPYTGQMFLVPSPDGSLGAESELDPLTPFGKAARIVIPSVEFKNATIREALDLVKNKSMELDTETDPARRGVNLVLKMAPSQEFDAAHRITETLTNISVLDALKKVAAAAGLFVGDERWAIAIKPENPLVFNTLVYRVPRAFLPDLQKLDNKGVKEYWKDRGIAFPEGSSVSFVAPARMVFHNTMGEQAKLGALFMGEQDEDGIQPRVEAANAERPEPAPPPEPKLTRQTQQTQPEFKIGQVDTRETAKGDKVVTGTFAHLTKADVEVRDLKVVSYFYEKNGEGKLELSKTRSVAKWMTPPIDWKETDPEKLVLQYRAGEDPHRTYAGCVLAVYYRGILQDAWSSSEELLKESQVPLVAK